MSDDIRRDELEAFAEDLRDQAWNDHPPGSLRGCKLLIAEDLEKRFNL